jgi:ribonuclease HI
LIQLQAQRKQLEFVVRTDSELVYEAWLRNKTVKTRHLKPLYQKVLALASELNVKLEQISGDSMKLVLGH